MMARKHINHDERACVLPDDFPQRLERIKEASERDARADSRRGR